MAKSVIIIGAGMGGLAAGCYGQMNGYDTQIFEMHTSPGGQCTSWKRKGYTFDICIHHFFGASPESKIYRIWKELGAMPREMVRPDECVSVSSSDGKLFRDYYDLNRLEAHLLQLSPSDSNVIQEYINAIKLFSRKDVMGHMMMGSIWSMLGAVASRPQRLRYFTLSMKRFAQRFSDPFLRRAFPLLVYSEPNSPMYFHLQRHAYGIDNALQWPVGGAHELAASIERRYIELGGKVHYRSKVAKILVENDKAVGIKLTDGSEYRADIVISNADGRKTIMEMLEGKYVDARTRLYCKEPADDANWAVHVFLGVNRDLSKEPSSLIMLLDEPVTIANHKNESLEMQMYGVDKTFAPPGKGVIKAELTSSYSYWKQLYPDKSKYKEEKQKVAEQVVDILEKRFTGIRDQIEVIDVPTPMTWERYLDETYGWLNFPNKKFSFTGAIGARGGQSTLPGLRDFYFAGAWATMLGALFGNALSGRNVIRAICGKDAKKFAVVE